MHPILFRIGNFPVYNYGVTMALAFLVAFGWVFYQAKKLGENMDDYYNICLIALVGGIVGARIVYVIVTWRYFAQRPLAIFNLRAGGLVWYGGVILAAALILAYAKWKGLSFYHIADIMSPPMAVGLAIGRIGCLMSGCCYGKPCDLPWAITYPPDSFLPPQIAGMRVHPTPIYEMIACLIIAGILIYIKRREKRAGQVFWSFFVLYGLARFVLEIWRGDVERGFIISGAISVSQGISIVMVLLAAVMLLRHPRSEKLSD